MVQTDPKGRVLTQTELIEAELDTLLADYKVHHKDFDVCFNDAVATTHVRKHLAALVLKHRHDVYFAAYRDGLVQGRKEQAAVGVTRFNQFYMLMQVSLVNSGVTMSEAKRILNEIKRRIDLTDEEWKAEATDEQ